ncbi:MAG: hypothetical protein ACOH2M_23230 [Cypionkella sp.]
MTATPALIQWSDFCHRLPLTRRQWMALEPSPVPFTLIGRKRWYSAQAVDRWIDQTMAVVQ